VSDASKTDTRLLRRIAAVPALYRAAYLKAIDGKQSPRQAIKAKCLDCCAWQREEVRQCTARGCPLWPLRPFQVSRRRPIPAEKPSPRGDFGGEVPAAGPEAVH
jgi:hypothetical protein